MTASVEAELHGSGTPQYQSITIEEPNQPIHLLAADGIVNSEDWILSSVESSVAVGDDTIEFIVSNRMHYRSASHQSATATAAVEATLEFTMPDDHIRWSYRFEPQTRPHSVTVFEVSIFDASDSKLLKSWTQPDKIKSAVFSNKKGNTIRIHVHVRGAMNPVSTSNADWEASLEMAFEHVDCNNNGVYDPTDVTTGTSADYDRNGYPDECNSPVIYVDRDADEGGDGSNWATAFQSLDDALALARSRTDQVIPIWITSGTYKPQDRLVSDDPRSATFSLPANVYLYGGFAGVEHDLRDRSPEFNPTILSGDLLGDDGDNFSNRSDNVRHVLRSLYGEPPGDLLLDSIIVRGGHADDPQYNFGGGLLADARTTLRNCTFEDNWSGPPSAEGIVAHSNGGGAVAVRGDNYYSFDEPGKVDVTWDNCTFRNNHSTGTGGGVFLSGLSVRFSNCIFDGNRAGYGGAMGFEQLFRLNFDNCLFRGNTATGLGGAIVVSYPLFEFVISGCAFEDNSASDGGAVYVRDGAPVTEIHTSSFSRNIAAGYGGAVRSEDVASIKLGHCTFDSCEAGVHGGALAMDDGSASLVGCDLSGNTATQGGAIHTDDLQLSIEDSIVRHNHATIGGGLIARGSLIQANRCRFEGNRAVVGGAVAVTSLPSSLRFYNSLFFFNSADSYGGAIAGGTGELTISRSTIAYNSSSKIGGALLAGPQTTIVNSIIWGNPIAMGNPDLVDEGDQIEGEPSVSHSIVQGWRGTWGGQGNSGANPLFVGRPSGNGEYEYRLQTNSPACNAGDPGYVAEFGEADLDGHARVFCGRVDMGAYESGFGDGDCDGEVDTWDFAVWVACAEGEIEGAACESMDSDIDGDFDLKDFAALQIAW